MAAGGHNEALIQTTSELNARVNKNREIWWSLRKSENELAAAMRISNKLFHFIRASGRKALDE